MADKKLLLDIQLQTDQFVDKIKTSRDALAKLKEDNKKLNEEANEALKNGLTATYEDLRNKIIANEAAQRQAGATIRDSQKSIDLQTKALNAQDGSYEQLLRNQQLAQTQLKLMEGTLQRNADGSFILTDAYKAQAEQVKVAKEALIAFDQGIKDGRTNVGNYTASFSEAIEKSGLFSEQLSVLKETYSGLKAGQDAVRAGLDLIREGFNSGVQGVKSFSAVVKESSQQTLDWFTTTIKASDAITTTTSATTEATAATEAMGVAGAAAGESIAAGAATGTTAMGALKVAIASTGIGLLVVALGAVVAFFEKTEKGAEMLERGLSALSAIFGVIVDKAAVLGEVIVGAFTNPKQALLDLGNFIKDQIINRFTALAVVAQGIMNLDFKQVANGVLQIGTGVENTTDKMKGLIDSTGKLVDQMNKAAQAAAYWKGQQQDLEDRMRSQNVEIEKNNLKIQEALKLSKDQTISAKDRIEALKEAGQLEQRNAALKAESSAKELEITREQLLANKELSATEKQRFTELTNSTTTLTQAQQEELNNLQSKANLRDEDLNKIVEARKAEIQAAGESEATQLTISKRLNAALAQERKQYLQTVLGIYAEEEKAAELSGAASVDLRRELAKQERDIALTELGLTAEQKLLIEKQYQNKLKEISNAAFDEQVKDYEAHAALLEAIRKRNADAEIASRKATIQDGDLQAELQVRLQEIQNGLLAESNARDKARADDLAKAEAATNKDLERLKFDKDFKSKTAQEQVDIVSGIIEKGRQTEADINASYDAQALAAVQTAGKQTADAVQQSNDKQIQQLLEFNKLKQEAGGGDASTQLQLKLEQLALEEQADVEHANNLVGTEEEKQQRISFIHEKYATLRAQVEQQSQDAQLAIISGALGQASSLFKKSTAAYKVLAIGQAIIDTHRAAVAALTPPPIGLGPVNGIPLVALSIATGLANVAKIQGVNFAAGGGRFRTKGVTTLVVGDNPGGVEEVTVRPISGTGRTHVDPSGNLVRMAGGGTLLSGTFDTPPINVPMAGLDVATLRDVLIDAVASMPNPVVGVHEFNQVSDKVTIIKDRATI